MFIGFWVHDGPNSLKLSHGSCVFIGFNFQNRPSTLKIANGIGVFIGFGLPSGSRALKFGNGIAYWVFWLDYGPKTLNMCKHTAVFIGFLGFKTAATHNKIANGICCFHWLSAPEP
jgi:hypothetical protein